MNPSIPKGTSTLLGHPKGLFILFLTEVWERFSFYGMRAILVLFLVDHVKGGFGWSEAAALKLYGINFMMVYTLSIPGGALADRYIGQKVAVLWGGILQCMGHFLLALSNETTFIVGLGFIAMGTGLLKPSISTMVGGLYKKGDVKRDSGFTIFYMGINIGGMLAAAIVGFVGEVYGWHYGFSLAGFGMLIGIITFLSGQKYLEGFGTKPHKRNKEAKAGNVATMRASFTKEEKDRLSVLFICLIAVCAFFVAFEQAGGLMNLYAKKYTNRYVFGWEIPASILQGLNPAFVILFGPIVAMLWAKLVKRYKHISSIYKMGVGNIIVGIGFLFMVGAALQRTNTLTAQSSLYWLVIAYLFNTIGELCLSPIFLAFITKVAPKRVRSSMMGIFFAVLGISGWLASNLGAQSVWLGDLTVFTLLFFITVLIGLPFIFFNRKLMRLTHGSEQRETQEDEQYSIPPADHSS
jgi:POT family proton-dependent oligopeptide transporter